MNPSTAQAERPVSRRAPAPVRFWAKVARAGVDDCWMWTGATTHDGYGQFSNGGRMYSSHRVAYVFTKGEIPKGYEVDHTCFEPGCVNPRHLDAVTHEENMRRRVARRTHCDRGHEYVPETTRMYRGWRLCRVCERENARRNNARKAAK